MAVYGDRVQLEQVVLNLILNGLDAVAERTIGQREVHVSTSFALGSVEVSVSDSGPGIRSPNLERVFEPFYTTKAHGLGMGLSICRSIVEAHGGEIRVENVEEGGAAFRCAFPAAGEPSGMTPPGAIVFVVDDDPSMLRALARLLKTAGHDVETFASSAEFLARPAHVGPGCVVLDLKMPGLSGLDVQEALAASARELPVVFISGHGRVPAAVRAMKAGAIDFLTKPFQDADLLVSVEAAIAQSLSSLADHSEKADHRRARAHADAPRAGSPASGGAGPAQQADRSSSGHLPADDQGPSRAGHGEDAGGLAGRPGPHGRTRRHLSLVRQHALGPGFESC